MRRLVCAPDIVVLLLLNRLVGGLPVGDAPAPAPRAIPVSRPAHVLLLTAVVLPDVDVDPVVQAPEPHKQASVIPGILHVTAPQLTLVIVRKEPFPTLLLARLTRACSPSRLRNRSLPRSPASGLPH